MPRANERGGGLVPPPSPHAAAMWRCPMFNFGLIKVSDCYPLGLNRAKFWRVVWEDGQIMLRPQTLSAVPSIT